MNEMRQVYDVQIPVVGGIDQWFTVARALTPEGAGAVVQSLLAHRHPDIIMIRVAVTTPIQ